MFKKLETKDQHAGCSRCNFQGCVWSREKYGETLGHIMWTIQWYSTKAKKAIKQYIRSFSELDYSQIENAVVANVNTRDYPDFCDAFIESATYKGRDMTETELERLNEDSGYVYELAIEKFY